MHLARLLWLPVCALILAGCGRQPAETPSGGAGGGSAPVPPSSRIGWDQQAADVAELNSLRFAIYIDGNRSELAGASCTPTAGSAGYPCAAPLPQMSAGQHTLELASYFVAGSIIESARSAPLTITIAAGSVTAATSAQGSEAAPISVARPRAASRELRTVEGARLRVDVLTAAESPSALAVAEDGTLFVGYGQSRIRVVRNREVIADEPLPSSDGADGPAILDIALDPQFPRTHHLYVLEVLGDESPTFRVSRFREAAGRLGERMVLLDRIPARRLSPTASLAFGSDGRLYIGLDDGDDQEEAQRLGSYSGKIVRLNADGTVPPEQRSASPVYASDFSAPGSLSWDTPGSSLWVADQVKHLVRRLGISSRSSTGDMTFTLTGSEKPRSIAIYRSGLIPELRGNLLLTTAEPRDYLLRARLTPDESALSVVERLTIPGGSPVRLVETSASGALYVATYDSVMRLTPW